MPQRLLLLLAFFAFPANAADFESIPSPDGKPYQYIYIRDVIVPGDDATLDAQLKSAADAGKQPVIDIASRGGDVDVAMAMGRSLRRSNAIAYHRYCASSCVFVFLGATQRYAVDGDGELLLHRPELGEIYVANPTPMGKKMMDMLRDYMTQMAGNSALYDKMMTIPFSNPEALSNGEALSLHALTVMPK